MTKYAAFLRGINVGGHRIILMEDLRKMFVSMNMKSVATYIQSGNVIFETPETDQTILTKKIEKRLQTELGYKVEVFLRTIPEIAGIVKNNPFKKITLDENLKLYVTLLAEEPNTELKRSLESFSNEKEMFRVRNRDLYCLCYKDKGKLLYSNNFIEKKLGKPATTRNWATMNEMLK